VRETGFISWTAPERPWCCGAATSWKCWRPTASTTPSTPRRWSSASNCSCAATNTCIASGPRQKSRDVKLPGLGAEDYAGGVQPGCAHDPTAGVGGRAAQVQVAHRRAVAGEARHRAEKEELIQRHGPLEDVPTGQVERPLQVYRSQHLPGHDGALEIRRVLVEQFEAAVG